MNDNEFEVMTEQEFLAVSVMGWQIERDAKIPASCEAVVDKDGMAVMLFSKFNPRENIEQAMMLLDKFRGWMITAGRPHQPMYTVNVFCDAPDGEIEIPKQVGNDSLTDAIVDAVLQAKGYEK